MKKKLGWIVFTGLILAGCAEGNITVDKSEDIKNEFLSVIQTEVMDSEINSYLDSEIELIDFQSHTADNLKFYEVSVKASLDEAFTDLSEERQYEVLEELDHTSAFDTNCGEESYCNLNNFTFENNGNIFIVDPTGGFEVEKDGESFNPAADRELEEYMSELLGDSASDLEEQEIYAYMKSVYDELTNYGANYDPEVHDVLVAQMAAKQFGITEEEADRIYIKVEMNGF